MSRRDTAEAIYDIAADEIEFTEANGKTLVPASKLTARSATKFLYSRRASGICTANSTSCAVCFRTSMDLRYTI